jgi:nucleoside-diphosphate-sugar epimerase
LYAFAGPGLPTDQHYAAGNFMRDGMRNLPIEIKGNPNTKRSYMYPADLTRHILNSLVSREVTTREVGSKETISICGLARVISENTNNSIVTEGDSSKPYSVYLPRTKGLLSETISLEESIQRWREWLSSL